MGSTLPTSLNGPLAQSVYLIRCLSHTVFNGTGHKRGTFDGVGKGGDTVHERWKLPGEEGFQACRENYRAGMKGYLSLFESQGLRLGGGQEGLGPYSCISLTTFYSEVCSRRDLKGGRQQAGGWGVAEALQKAAAVKALLSQPTHSTHFLMYLP